MKLGLVTPETARLALKDVRGRTPQARFEHRLHCVVLVGEGRSCLEVAQWFDDDPRSVQRWVRRFLQSGVEGLKEGVHTGRPPVLTDPQIHELGAVLKDSPREYGHPTDRWRSDTVAAEVARRFGVTMSRRSCQRLVAILGPVASTDAD